MSHSPPPSASTPGSLDPYTAGPTLSLTISPSSTIHPTDSPSSPLYFLPTSPSTHTLTLPIAKYTPTTLTSRSRDTLGQNKLFTINRIPTTDTYTFTCHVPGHEGNGVVKWVSGWLWGGTWEAEFGFFDESADRERRLVLKFPGGEPVDGLQWMLSELSLVFPPQKSDDTQQGDVDDEDAAAAAAAAQTEPTVTGLLAPEVLVAQEQSNRHPAPPGEVGAERGETILIYTGKPEVTDVVREFITVVWVTKCWCERTRSPGWFGKSVKDTDKGAKGLKYKW